MVLLGHVPLLYEPYLAGYGRMVAVHAKNSQFSVIYVIYAQYVSSQPDPGPCIQTL